MKFEEYLAESNIFHGKNKNVWGGAGEAGHNDVKKKLKSLEKEGFKHHETKKVEAGPSSGYMGSHETHHIYKHPDGRTVTHVHSPAKHSPSADIHNLKVEK